MMKRNKVYFIQTTESTTVRYWFDDEKELHTAVWYCDECIIQDDDTDSYIIKGLVKVILDLQGKEIE